VVLEVKILRNYISQGILPILILEGVAVRVPSHTDNMLNP